MKSIGQAMFERARGQFAVSLWDRNDRTLILGRDRVGICPLYYAQADGWLLWGSENRALLASGLFIARPDVRGIDHFFTFFGAGTTRTFLKGSSRFRRAFPQDSTMAGSRNTSTGILIFPTLGSERRLDDPGPLISEFEAILREAVERRLRSDVPVVSYISGGLDSTVVLGLCGQQRTRSDPGRSPSASIELDQMNGRKRPKRPAMLGSPLFTMAVDRGGHRRCIS